MVGLSSEEEVLGKASSALFIAKDTKSLSSRLPHNLTHTFIFSCHCAESSSVLYLIMLMCY